MDVVLGLLLGFALAAFTVALARLLRAPRRVLHPSGEAMRAALHAAAATLPHLRRGLTPATAAKSAPYLRALTGAQAVAEQSERLAEAELRALRAQISPHFIYNALAAVANSIHERPDEARDLLADFAQFIRYAFRSERPYVTLADELHYVEKYLRLEQARFGERLAVRVEVAPDVLTAVVPALSLQPLVENAVRHGVESRDGVGHVAILGRDLGGDVELRVCDDGAGVPEEEVGAILRGRPGGGIGVANVNSRLQTTFGPAYALHIERPAKGTGTEVVMRVPKFRAGVRAA